MKKVEPGSRGINGLVWVVNGDEAEMGREEGKRRESKKARSSIIMF